MYSRSGRGFASFSALQRRAAALELETVFVSDLAPVSIRNSMVVLSMLYSTIGIGFLLVEFVRADDSVDGVSNANNSGTAENDKQDNNGIRNIRHG